MERYETKNMVLASILTALVVILQLLGSFIKLGPFSISVVLAPIVIGAATCGVGVGAWLGFVFGIIVLLSGDAAIFFAANIPGTIIVVLLKGVLCGFAAGVVYKVLEKINRTLAVCASSVVCPVVNTGIFLLGCSLFFKDTMLLWAEGAGFGGNVAQYMLFVLVGMNFIVELVVNAVLSPVIIRLLNVRKN